MTLFEIKEKMQTFTDEINSIAGWIAEKSADMNVPLTEISEKEVRRDELKTRLDTLKREHDRMEESQRHAIAVNTGVSPETDRKEAMAKAKAAFYKAAILGQDAAAIAKQYEGLGAIPALDADLGNGSNLLPTNMSSELLLEPFDDNTLRSVEPVSNITGLEEPKLLFSIDEMDLADITDKDTAKEIEVDGDIITYGRFKTKVYVTLKDTVLHGSPYDLVTQVENGLRSALSTKEKLRAFAVNPDSDHAHMSFYQTGIKNVAGDTIIDAIIAALGDLSDMFAGNACVVMRRQDYYRAVRTLSNGAESLFGKKPEEVIGVPVIFNDRAVRPVIGDFRYARQNYDIGTTYETDKDGKKGEYYFILTAWGDHQIRLKSAFRIAIVGVQVIGAIATASSGTPTSGDTISAVAQYSDPSAPAAGAATYKWQYLNGDAWVDDSTHTGNSTATITTVASTDAGLSFRCHITYVQDGVTSDVYSNIVGPLV
jgi:HK97 family phage major capsid protein